MTIEDKKIQASKSDYKPLYRQGPYKSQYGPKYQYQRNLMGITPKQLFGTGMKAGLYGGVALFAVIFYASGVPRVKKDILQKVPVIGEYFINEVPASDSPF
ncbi:ubiquinol-cytochrome-c reductase complex subunit-domain-containing protein [Xylariaceae sp. FL0804]|nr:ubiquinol-cytochrome-c reductase complex subunit-domain-containing protein [Xylariaceae sp. FL0804]